MSGWLSGACRAEPVDRPGLGACEGPLTLHAAKAVAYVALGWTVDVREHAVWLLAGHPYDAVTVAGKAGRYVLRMLHRDGVVGPVAFWPGEGFRYVFLVRPGGHELSVVREPLSGLGVEYRWAGQRIDLPAYGRGLMRPRWLVPPDRPAPTAGAVMATSLSVFLGDRRHNGHTVDEPAWP